MAKSFNNIFQIKQKVKTFEQTYKNQKKNEYNKGLEYAHNHNSNQTSQKNFNLVIEMNTLKPGKFKKKEKKASTIRFLHSHIL